MVVKVPKYKISGQNFCLRNAIAHVDDNNDNHGIKKWNIHPLTPRALCQKCIFWTFWKFWGWMRANLAPIYSNRHLKHEGMPFFPLGRILWHFCLGMHRNQKWPTFLGFWFFFFRLSFSPFLIFLLHDWPSTGLASHSKTYEKTS